MSADYFSQPTLRGHGLRLEPLGLSHEQGLKDAAADGELWNIRVTSVPQPQQTRKYIEDALRMHAERKRVPYAVIDEATGKVLGSTSFHDLIPEAQRLEIGYTWYAKSVHRSHVNTSTKLLMMARGFDELGAQLVGWRTDIFNFASQRAIERLGAEREGVLRSHALRRDGSVRDSVIYGMLAKDWPAAKTRLLERLEKGHEPRRPLDLSYVPLADLDFEATNRLARLDAGAGSNRFVANNGASIADHLKSANSELLAIMNHAQPVGLMLLYDPAHDPELARKDCALPNALYLWRFMVAFKHQGQGIGQAALAHFSSIARSRPHVTELRLSHGQDPGHAGPMYERFGFAYTGELDGGERVMTMALHR